MYKITFPLKKVNVVAVQNILRKEGKMFMPCLTSNPYTIQGCTDASVYYKGATTIDFQLEIQSNPAGAPISYKANLQFYNTNTSTWQTLQVKSGTFTRITSLFSYELSSKPQGTYRIKVDFTMTGASFSAQTSNFYVYK